MTNQQFALDPQDPLAPQLRQRIGAEIASFIEARRLELDPMGPDPQTLIELAALFTRGGKRLRPAFAVWGYVAAAGLPANAEPLLRAAASLDLLHVSALVHDDVMDASDTRRGVPAAHRQFEALHAQREWLGRSSRFGEAAAILLGDLLVMWSVDMLEGAGLDPAALDCGRPLIQAMRTEVTCGQYLDVVAQHRPRQSAPEAIEEAGRVVEFKTARYTVLRPCQFGAALGSAGPEVLDALGRFGSPLGRAFQYRDDVLGVFGNAALTGKPAGDDLREAKRTLLLAQAYAGTSPAGAARLDALVGNPELSEEELIEARRIIEESGALRRVEHLIETGLAEAVAVLDEAELTEPGRRALTALAYACVRREA